MRRFFADMNPTLRGFLIILTVVLVIVLLSLESTVISLLLLARIAFFLAIAFFIYLLWRERRSDISTWPGRARLAFYGGAVLIVTSLGIFFLRGASGRNALAMIVIIALSAFSMFRVWREQHTYG
ncbi:MAG: hypothetical protein M3310_06455 [Actinomycetota bacterium]|nr:hypothetical protein [Actinomycetota bacterium]